MANIIKHKRSSTAGAIPTASQLEQGQIAVNLTDKKLYTKDASNAVIELARTITIPPAAKSANYTLVKADVGGHVAISDGSVTIPPSVFEVGDVIVLYNNNATTSRSVVRGSGVTLFWVNGVDANRTLGVRGLATILCVGSNQFVITGQGVS